MFVEYRIQTYFAALQTIIIVLGSFAIALVSKVSGHSESLAGSLGFFASLIHWSYFLLILPVLWVILSIKLGGLNSRWFTRRWMFVTGMLSLFLLSALYFFILISIRTQMVQVAL